MSTAQQVPGTVHRFFGDCQELEILKVKVSSVNEKLKWEASSSHGVFPHIHGNLLSSDIVESQIFTRDSNMTWEEQLLKESFLQ